MKKTIRLTESDLTKMVKRIIKENKTKRKLNEGLDEVEDLSYRLTDIFHEMEDFIRHYDELESYMDSSDEDVVHGMEEMARYREMFEQMLH
jgi:hypothetical protein